jgi:hypothetical protein
VIKMIKTTDKRKKNITIIAIVTGAQHSQPSQTVEPGEGLGWAEWDGHELLPLVARE